MKGQYGSGGGPGGNCICLKCGAKAPHRPGTPCMKEKCPQCGATMVREGSEHHLAFQRKKERSAPVAKK